MKRKFILLILIILVINKALFAQCSQLIQNKDLKYAIGLQPEDLRFFFANKQHICSNVP